MVVKADPKVGLRHSCQGVEVVNYTAYSSAVSELDLRFKAGTS